MSNIAYLNDRKDVIQTVRDGEELICEFCDHEFKPGERYVQDVNLACVCPAAACGLSDTSCYVEDEK